MESYRPAPVKALTSPGLLEQLGIRFPGLRPGDRWRLCADRWQEALEAGVAPPVVLAATQEAALAIVRREDPLRYAVDVAGGAV